MSNYWKRKLKELNEDNSASSGNYWENKQAELKEEEQKTDDIAPVVTTAKDKEDDNGLDFFQKGAFEDGFDWSDLILAPLATVADVGVGVVKGASKLVGGITDAGMYGVAGLADLVGADDFANDVRVKAKENTIDNAFRGIDDSLDKYSVLGKTSDAVSEGLGQVAAIILTGGAAGAAGLGAVGATAVTTGTMGLSSFGSGMSEAYAGGATDEEAATYGLISGVVNAGSELIFGGLGKTVKALGLSKGLSSLDDMFAKKLSSKIANQTAKNFVEFGVKASAEGVEEVLAGIGTIAGKKLTYMSEEELSKLIEDENLLEQFVVGAVTSGISQSGLVPGMKGGSLSESNQKGRDFITGLTKNEQAVVDKEYADRIAEEGKNGKVTEKRKAEIYDEVLSDMEKGHITTDTIEEVLGGDSYKAYQDAIKSEEEALNELAELYEGEELQQQINDFLSHSQRDGMQAKLSESVFETVKGDRLAESYLDRARRGETFKADLSQYDAKVRPMIQKAIDSGVLNNTNRTHEFVDMIAKIATDKGVSFDFTSNEKLKDSIFAVDGKTVNGFVTEDGVTLNVNSAKALNKVVGHEITHVLEGTELYTELQNVLFEYAKGRKAVDSKFDSEYKERLYNARNLYKDVKGYQGVDGFNKIKNEVAADLVGDYLFSDTDFIKKLSVEHRNVFQKMFDEVKYLCKVATAGSKEARELAKLQKAFEDAYRGSGKQSDGTRFSLTGKNQDGIEVYETSKEIMDLTWDERKAKYLDVMKNEYRGRTAKFERNGHTYYAKFDQSSVRKPIYGDSRSSQNGVKALIKAGADGDVFDLVENSKYTGSRRNTKTHTNADYFDYFVKTVQIDGKVFDLMADVEKEYGTDEGYVYTLALIDNKKMKASPALGTPNAGPVKNAGNASGNNVAQIPGNVNYSLYDSDGKQLTKEQRDYFKDSKMRDENGNLKVMYHGSPAQFTVFDKKKAKSSGHYGRGFYFSDSDSHAGTYGNTYSVYLNIRDPLQDGGATVSRDQVRSFLEAVAENEDYSIENYGTYDIDEVLGNIMGRENSVDAFKVIQDISLTAVGDMVEATELFNDVNGTTFDGIVVPTETVAFYPEQIKSVANEKPTSDPDIRYSLSKDSDGRELPAAVQKRFGKSVVVDENGRLKVVYHGTATGEFSVFDKAKGSVDGDFGSGFYFTDNEADVSEHYEGGGPDFDNKVARLAEQIEAEEEIDYDEAEERAREQLYKGSHKFEVYLNIENPAIVGETMLLNSDSYMEQYNEEDYDDYDDYLADVEQLVADDIDNVIWEVERNVDVNDTEGISGVLWDAYSEGGIGLEELKARLNNLYLEDSNCNFVANEVARQIIESLGYDGIVDPTVSGKWNMDIEEGTTHYIVFKSNQIKAVTNENPTDNPDIHRSLSRAGEQYAPTSRNDVFGKDIALETAPVKEVAPVQKSAPATVAENATVPDVAPAAEPVEQMFPDDLAPLPDDGAERIDSLTDADAPPEVDAPYYEDGEVAPDNPMEGRYIEDVGDRSVKAYMYENPEVKPFFQAEANVMLGELHNSIKGERWYNDQVYYESGGEYGWGGVKRDVSDDIAYLLDGGWNGNGKGYTYKQIEDGLKAIIEDHGAENNAVSKRIEFILNDRLMQGHTNFPLDGMDTPPNQDYLRLLEEKQITEYSKEAFDAFMANADDYAPPVKEDIAPVPTQTAPVAPVVAEKSAPIKEASLSIKPKAQKEPRMARATPQEQARARVLTEEPKVDKSKPTAWNLFKDNFVDKGTVFETLSLKTGNRELQAKWKSIGRAESSAQWFMEHGSADTRSLKAIRETVEQSGKTQQFYEYLYHRHNVDRMSLRSKAREQARQLLKNHPLLNKLSKTDKFADIMAKVDEDISQVTFEEFFSKELFDKKTGLFNSEDYRENNAADLYDKFEELVKLSKVVDKPVFGYSVTSKMSKAEAAKLEAANPKFKVWAEDVYSYMTTLREMMVDNGVISRETADLWAEMYPHYVPVRRKGDEGLNINVALDTKRTGVNAPIKRATGGNRDILPLFDTMAMRTEQTYRAVARNRFGVELKNLLGTTVDHGTLSVDEAIDSVETELLKEGKDGKNPTFTVFENGERVEFEITDEMYNTMKPKSDAMAYTNKVLNTANNIRRGLLTEYNPAFMLTNPIKDTQDVILNSQHPAKTYANYPAAIAELIGKNGQYYREYMEHGGEMNTYFDGETKTFAKEKSGLAKVLGFPLDKISQANNFIERIPRMAEYIASRKEGRSIDVSMLDAARVTTDFSAGGDVVKAFNRNGFTFLNASVQGAAQQVRNVREAWHNGVPGVLSLAAKVAVAGLPAILLNHLLWDDDEEYAELSDYVKQNYYIIGKYGDGKFVRVPKGRALAVVQNAFKQMENLVTGNDDVDLDAFKDLVLSNLAPNNPLENNIASPVMQAWKNKAWYGDALVPTRLQDLPAAEQYDETTDSISKWLGEKLNISPYKINYVMDQYLGGVGDMILPMLTPEAERGNDSLAGKLLAPITDKFTTDSVLKNQNVSDFYDTKDELSMNAKASGATDEDVLMSKYMNSINAELSDLYKRKRELQNSTYSDDVKYNAVRDIQRQIVDLTRESMNTYEDVSISGGYATIGDRHYRKNDDGEWTKLTDKQLEKQEEVTRGLDISPSEYWGNKEEYDYAYEYPEKYAVAKSVGGYKAYRQYSSELYDIKADKDKDGKSITGSRKEKVLDWINALDADYGTKIILFKSEYNADDTYNYDILDYLNSRSDISYAEMETILKELGFTVHSDGTVTW